jgi:hypothetical protein
VRNKDANAIPRVNRKEGTNSIANRKYLRFDTAA